MSDEEFNGLMVNTRDFYLNRNRTNVRDTPQGEIVLPPGMNLDDMEHQLTEEQFLRLYGLIQSWNRMPNELTEDDDAIDERNDETFGPNGGRRRKSARRKSKRSRSKRSRSKRGRSKRSRSKRRTFRR